MNDITKKLLSEVSDFKGEFKGAYNIREDGECAGRQSSENIIIESKTDGPGLVIHISSKAQKETVYIPACVTHGNIDDLVYNDFYVGAGADVTIVAGCGVHTDNEGVAKHNGIHRFFLEKGAHVLYQEKHIGTGIGKGLRKIDPVTDKVNMSGKYFHCVPYGVNDDGFIDYDRVLEIAKECKPKLIVAGASAYARAIDFKRFREIADEVGAYLMVDMAHIAGLVAAGLHMSPIPYAHVTTTTTHKTLRGPRGGMIMCSNEINEKFNFNKAVFPGIQGGPLMHVIAGKAVCFKEALTPEFKAYQEQVVKNAAALAKALMARGFDIVSGGTDNHLMLMDLKRLGLTGKEVEKLLDEVHITANKNTVPNDPKSPFVTSGIRLGTPAVTTRGANEADMEIIADAIKAAVLDNDKAKAEQLVKSIVEKYPLYA